MRPRNTTCASICDAVGNTPLVRLDGIDASIPGVEIWAKLEFMNPGGSVKDRAALNMLLTAEQAGLLEPGMNIIDSTSGNTGVALALYGAARGYGVTLVMPENVSRARKSIVRAFGAEVIYSDPMEGSDGAIVKVRAIVDANPGKYFFTDQYNNAANPGAHENGTAQEIIAEVGDRVTHLVTGIGTSGTVMGTGRGLKAYRADIRVLGVEPDDAFHGLEGLKHIESSIVPGIYDPTVLDDTIFMDTEAGWIMTERLAVEEGIIVGHSSGASVAGAEQTARQIANRGETGLIVTILADHGSRYVEVKGT